MLDVPEDIHLGSKGTYRAKIVALGWVPNSSGSDR